MDTKSDEQFLVIEATIEYNKQYYNNNHKKTDWENHTTHREPEGD